MRARVRGELSFEDVRRHPDRRAPLRLRGAPGLVCVKPGGRQGDEIVPMKKPMVMPVFWLNSTRRTSTSVDGLGKTVRCAARPRETSIGRVRSRLEMMS
jgi:hypothetical protein